MSNFALAKIVPHLSTWLLRLGSDSAILQRFAANPVIFSSWYALAHDWVGWPDEVVQLQTAERNKKLSFERTLSLLTKVNYNTHEEMDVEYARSLLEGYAVHDWVQQNLDTFAARLKVAASAGDFEVYREKTGCFSRVLELAEVLELSELEKQLVYLALACGISAETRTLFDQLCRARKTEASQLWATMFGCPESALLDILSPTSALRLSGLVSFEGEGVRLPMLSELWLRVVLEGSEPLLERLVHPWKNTPGVGLPARIADEDRDMAAEILAKAREPGVNLLLYGADGLEKRAMLFELLSRAGRAGYQLRDHKSTHNTSELPTLAYVAQRALFQEKGYDAVLVIDQPGAVLERRASDFMRFLMGMDIAAQTITPFDEMLLAKNPAPTVWAGPGADSLPEETVARFVFHAPLQKARRLERRQQLEALVAELKLSKKTADELLHLEDVSALQLATAKRAAALAGGTTKKDREAALVQAVKRSLKALNRDTTPKSKECVTEYSLKYLNCRGRFGPEQVLKALSKRPRGSLCLYGLPGTGKTQFVEYLAQSLGRPLMSYRASDLLSKYVGDAEKNIAAMFAEAEAAEAILFLDEGDSFLRARDQARQAHEVSQVNELLQHMERFEGIFIVATNLFRGLDAAALRRFTFKMEFQALHPEQRWDMFIAEAGLKGKLSTLPRAQRDAWFDSLTFMQHLTAGDFATVKRQCILLEETLSPEAWISQLQMECDVKTSSTDNRPILE